VLDLYRGEREAKAREEERLAYERSHEMPDDYRGDKIGKALTSTLNARGVLGLQQGDAAWSLIDPFLEQARQQLAKSRAKFEKHQNLDIQGGRFSRRVEHRQPKSDYTINELPLAQPLPTDTVAFWSNQYGKTQQALVSAFTSSNVSGLVVNVQDYGAKGDGTTDDTAAITRAIAACQALPNGGCLFFPAGNYIISSTLLITNGTNMTIAGVGIASQVSAQGDYDIFKVTGGKTGMAWMNIDLEYPAAEGKLSKPSIVGSAINIQATVTDTFYSHVFTNGVGIGLTAFAGGGRNVAYGCKFIGDYLGVYIFGHGLKIIGCTVNGGTYGLVSDGGADPKIFECPFFGCLSILSMNTTGKYKGGTFYIFDGEGNFGPPPSTSGTFASGTYTLGGTPTTGQTHTYIIDGYSVVCSETTGKSLTQTASDDAVTINAFFANPANFPLHPDDQNEVAAVGGTGVVTITATAYGYGGNKIKTVSSNGSGVTLSNPAGNHLAGGSDNGLWPGDSADTIGQLATASGLTVGCGGYLIGGDHAQCNIIVNWVKDGIVFGDQDTTGPGFIDVIGGNIGASTKGKTQITTYALDFQNVGQVKVIGVALSPGNGQTGAIIHIPTASWVTGSVIVESCYFKINDQTYAILGDDNTALVSVHDNDMDINAGNTIGGYGWMIQITGQSTAPPLGTNGNWVAYRNRGFNPFGWVATISNPGTGTISNTYGMSCDLYITGSVTSISVPKNDGVSYVLTGLTSGTFHLGPGAKLKIASSAATTIQVVAD